MSIIKRYKANSSILSLIVLSLLLAFAGCSDQKSDLEEARYNLAKGDADGGARALEIVQGMLTTEHGSNLFEAYRIYAGAKLELAGFNGIQMVSSLLYKGSNSAIAIVNNAVTLNANSAQYVKDAEDGLNTFIATSDFANSTDIREQNGIYFQLGLAYFFDALQNTLSLSGLSSTGTVDDTTCTTNFTQNVLQQSVIDNLTSSNTNLQLAQLESGNSLVTLVTNLQNEATNDLSNIQKFCDYINSNKNLN